MSKPTRRLGRGLSSLVTDLRAETSETGTPAPEPKGDAKSQDGEPVVAMLRTSQLHPNPHQPRDMNLSGSIASLAQSIEHSGMLQPITVRKRAGRYEVIAGERRWRAAESIGMDRVPVIIREATEEQMVELALIENIQREDLNAIDRARAYRQFCDGFDLKPGEVADRVGEDRTTVVNYLRLLDLPDEIQGLVSRGALSMGHARCLLGVTDGIRQQRLAEAAVGNELSVRALEEIVRRQRSGRSGGADLSSQDSKPRSAHLGDLQRRFEEALKTKVVIREGRRKGKGRIVIDYYSLDDFERIAAMLGVNSGDESS